MASGVWQRTQGPWFFITADYAYGHAVEAAARARLAKLGGKVAGSVETPLSTTDFSALLLSGATASELPRSVSGRGPRSTTTMSAWPLR